jgi:hypothetical protein
MLGKISWYLPYFIQLLVAKVDELLFLDAKKTLSEKTIDEAYKELLIVKHFGSWDERLQYYGELAKSSREVLKLLCTGNDGRSGEDLLANLSAKKANRERIENDLAKLLNMLQNDGYLVEKNGKYLFRSPLLRDFWHKRFIL